MHAAPAISVPRPLPHGADSSVAASFVPSAAVQARPARAPSPQRTSGHSVRRAQMSRWIRFRRRSGLPLSFP
eukprot:5688840-Pleurochrysis_carterae.AAC.1